MRKSARVHCTRAFSRPALSAVSRAARPQPRAHRKRHQTPQQKAAPQPLPTRTRRSGSRWSVCQKNAVSRRPNGRATTAGQSRIPATSQSLAEFAAADAKKVESFSPAACTAEKIPLGSQTCALCIRGVQCVRCSEPQPLPKTRRSGSRWSVCL